MSMKSKQRTTVIGAYRGRGRANSNLWLVYSVKTQRDWILTSDRELVYWLSYLETNPDVVTFSFDNDYEQEKLTAQRRERPLRVIFRSGSKACLNFDEEHNEPPRKSPGLADETSLSQAQNLPSLTQLSTEELKKLVPCAMRWLEAIAFAAAIRDLELIRETAALLSAINAIGSGDLQRLVSEMHAFDDQTIYGVIVRLAIGQSLVLDLTKNNFAGTTPWKIGQEIVDVVSQ